MPKHTLSPSLRAVQNAGQDMEQTKRRVLGKVNEVAPGLGGVLGPALLGLEAGLTTFAYATPDSDPVVLELPGTHECEVMLHPADKPGDSGRVVYRLAEVSLANNVSIEVRPPNKYADQV